MKYNASKFISENSIGQEELTELIQSMEAISRPALIVDGQHRTWGASKLSESEDLDIRLTVVALTNCTWIDSIYQFIIINEKAEKVDTELLNDIFASSLTPTEQGIMRDDFGRVKVDIEARIAGVLAGRDQESPFFQMVKLNLPNPPESEKDAYISQTIIQNLIEGGRGSKSWRTDPDFFERFIKPTFNNINEWQDWKDGNWKRYWNVIWETVSSYYTEQAKQVKGRQYEIWSKRELSNLTKGVGLKMLQRYFITWVLNEWVIDIEKEYESARRYESDEEKIKEKVDEVIAEKAISNDLDEFTNFVKTEFLENIPVNFFTQTWKTSLDDGDGHDAILYELDRSFGNDRWRASAASVFTTGKKND